MKTRPLGQTFRQAVNAKERFLKEIKTGIFTEYMNDRRAEQSYCWCGESFNSLKR